MVTQKCTDYGQIKMYLLAENSFSDRGLGNWGKLGRKTGDNYVCPTIHTIHIYPVFLN